uniref:Uncharacterized protein n=1 Tax=Vespula pensylvanica TaxID=30213 RepID=A0A834KQ60_VESPE|nr:hypothetical protein H0235_013538 [Vespula pensylvanica]
MKLRKLNTELGQSWRIYQGLTPTRRTAEGPWAPLVYQVYVAITTSLALIESWSSGPLKGFKGQPCRELRDFKR